MASLVKDGLEKLWKESPFIFDNFKYVPQEKVDSLIQKFLKNFAEMTWDTDDEHEEDPPEQFSGKKSPAARGIDANDWCEVLHLRSGDNDRATYIYNTVNNKFNTISLGWVKNIISPCIFFLILSHLLKILKDKVKHQIDIILLPLMQKSEAIS